MRPVVLCIDVEPDPRTFDRGDRPPWEGFERLTQEFRELRGRLSEATERPATITWALRMDPQVADSCGSATWIADNYGDELKELTEVGDELALHTHVWRWDADAREWVDDFSDVAWTKQCLTMSLDAYEAAFGRACAVHRGGDYFLSGEMLSILAERGVKIDLTVEPGLPPQQAAEGETARGSSPDYTRAPHRPYRATAASFPARDRTSRSNPLIVPLLSARRLRPPFRRMPLYLWDPPAGFGRRLTAELLVKPPPILAFAVRSGDAVVYPELWAKTVANLEQLAERRRTAFMTASAAVEATGAAGG